MHRRGVATAPEPGPPTLVRRANGRIEWAKTPGALEWFKAMLPDHTNKEVLALVKGRWGVDITPATINSMRVLYGLPQTPETRAKAHREARHEEPPPGPERLELSGLREQVRKLNARQTFYELVGQAIRDATLQLPALVPPHRVMVPPRHRGLTEEEMVLLVSDVQIGQRVDATESGGLGNFSMEIFLEELAYLKDAVLSIARYHPNATRLHVWFLGDIVEGETIFSGQLRSIDRTVVQQVMIGVEQFGRFLVDMQVRFPEIHCAGVIGNHGRVGRFGEHSPMSNFDFLLYHWLQDRTATVKGIRWEIPQSWWHLAEVQGWGFLLVHGDDTGPGWAGIPYYAVTRHKSRYRELFHELKPGKDFSFMCIGHHCLPERARILTRSGFRRHDEIMVGDEVLAYDRSSAGCRWVPLQATHRYESAPTVRLESRDFRVEATGSHRWVVTAQHAHGVYERQTDDLRRHDRLVVAARAEDGGLNLDGRDAAVIGWLVTDGWVSWENGSPNWNISQKKAHYVTRLRHHLRGLYTSERAMSGHPGVRVWHLRADYVRDLVLRTGFKVKADLPGLVTRLPAAARQAMIEAMECAEGARFAQNAGPVFESYLILCALQGYRTGRPRKMVSGHGGEGCLRTRRSRRGPVTVATLRRIAVPPGPVWCPTTPFGTWVAELDGQVFITGNSQAAAFNGIIMNGSWPGGTEFSLKRLQLGDMPSQTLFGVHRKHGVTWRREVNLRPRPGSPL